MGARGNHWRPHRELHGAIDRDPLSPDVPRLPDEQQIKLTVLEPGSSASPTAAAKAQDCGGEICSGRAPFLNMAESVEAPIRRDLYVPTITPWGAAPHAGACDR